MFRTLRTRVNRGLRSAKAEQELADEIQAHLAIEAAERRAHGEPESEARAGALREFGSVALVSEVTREAWGWSAWNSFLKDLRYGLRGLRRNPGFAATAILSLGLAIGVTTAVYSILDASLRDLPVQNPQELISLARPSLSDPGSPAGEVDVFSYPVYRDLRAAAGDGARLGLFSHGGRAEIRWNAADPMPETATRQYISGDGFQILGVTPAAGRLIGPDDDTSPGAHPVAVLSYRYWHSRFGGDPAIVGRTLRDGGSVYTVIGVAREGFFGVEPGKTIDFWLPAMMYEKESFANVGWQWLRIVGRLAPGQTPQSVRGRMQPAFHSAQIRLVSLFPQLPEAIRSQIRAADLRVRPAPAGVSNFRKDYGQSLWLVAAIAAGILFIACANCGSMLLARSAARAPEMAMRVSLGAGSGRLVRQLLTESLALALLAGALGWLLAITAAPALLTALSTVSTPVWFDLRLESRVLLACLGITTVAALLFGIIPALQVSRVSPGSAAARKGGAPQSHWGRAFVAAQIAGAVCLVLAGMAFAVSLRKLVTLPVGFDPDTVTVLNLQFEAPKISSPKGLQAAMDLERQVRAQAGISSVASAAWPIFAGMEWSGQIEFSGQPPSEQEVIFYRVSPAYLDTLRTPLLRGRPFREADAFQTGRVPVIVNSAFLKKHVPAGEAIGRNFRIPGDTPPVLYEVAGIAADARYRDLRHEPEPIVYLPLESAPAFTLYIRSALTPGQLARIVDRESRSLGTGFHVSTIVKLDTIVDQTILRERLLSGVGGALAILGLLLASIGVFGLLNYQVTQRTREIGIRAALGARRSELVLLVFREVAVLAAAGIAVGVIAARPLSRSIESLLYQLTACDPPVLAGSVMLVLFGTLIAGCLPAYRAATVNPIIALRFD